MFANNNVSIKNDLNQPKQEQVIQNSLDDLMQNDLSKIKTYNPYLGCYISPNENGFLLENLLISGSFGERKYVDLKLISDSNNSEDYKIEVISKGEKYEINDDNLINLFISNRSYEDRVNRKRGSQKNINSKEQLSNYLLDNIESAFKNENKVINSVNETRSKYAVNNLEKIPQDSLKNNNDAIKFSINTEHNNIKYNGIVDCSFKEDTFQVEIEIKDSDKKDNFNEHSRAILKYNQNGELLFGHINGTQWGGTGKYGEQNSVSGGSYNNNQKHFTVSDQKFKEFGDEVLNKLKQNNADISKYFDNK